MKNILKHKAGGAVKSVEAHEEEGELLVEGYLVTWGNENDTDLQGEFFTPRTEFCLDWFKERPALYHHGLDGDVGLRTIGTLKSIEMDDLGLWVKAQLNKRDQYARAVYDMVKTKEFGWSSGSVDHLVKIAPDGEIAVWPLIEGSITPTPAQPAKTTVRALKNADAIYGIPETPVRAFVKSLQGNNVDPSTREFLREFKARVESYADDNEDTKKAYKSRNEKMSASKKLTRAFARSFGIRADDEELNKIASDVSDTVEAVVAKAAADELEEQAALAALEEEQKVEETTMARNIRNMRNRRSLGRARRSEEVLDDLANKMADELASEAETVSPEATETAKRFRARRAMRRALRNMRRASRTASDDLMAEFAGDVDVLEANDASLDDFVGDVNAKGYRARRRPVRGYSSRRGVARRGFARREGEVPAEELNEELAQEAAAQSYRAGFRRGARSAFRFSSKELGSGEIEQVIVDDLPEAKAFSRRARRSLASRGFARREGDAALEEAVDEALSEAGKRIRSSRSRRGFARREGEVPVEHELVSEEPAVASRRFRSRRSAYRENAPVEEVAPVEENTAYASRSRRSRRNLARRGYSYREGEAAAPVEEVAPESVASRRFRGKSINNRRGENYWRNRAMKAEMMEAPGQRTFGRVKRDSADQDGAYSRAFKSYLLKGLGLLNDREVRILEGKGKTNWGDVSGAFKAENGSYKTYYGGNDTAGGFAVPPDWIAELNKNIMTQTVMAPECKTYTTTSNQVLQPSLNTTDARRAHRANVAWVGEENSSTAASNVTDDVFEQIRIPIHIMLMNETASLSMLEDATFSIEDHINESFSEAVAVAYDQLTWYGDGQNKLEGITVNPRVTGSASTGVQTVGGYIPSGSASGITNGDAIRQVFMNLPRQYRARAKWYMNSDTALAISQLKDGTGRPLFEDHDTGLANAGVPERLLGRPIVYNEWATDIAANAFPIVFGDLSRAYTIAKRVEFSIRRFEDSQQALLDRIMFIGRARVGGQVTQPAALKVLKIATS